MRNELLKIIRIFTYVVIEITSLVLKIIHHSTLQNNFETVS